VAPYSNLHHAFWVEAVANSDCNHRKQHRVVAIPLQATRTRDWLMRYAKGFIQESCAAKAIIYMLKGNCGSEASFSSQLCVTRYNTPPPFVLRITTLLWCEILSAPPPPLLPLLQQVPQGQVISTARRTTADWGSARFGTPPLHERQREIYFKSHISLWEHSSHFRTLQPFQADWKGRPQCVLFLS